MNDITIVDDNATALAHMRRVLQRAGLGSARTFRCPKIAVQELAISPPSVLVIDYRMPGMSGIEVIRRLHAQRRLENTRVVMLTGDPDLHQLHCTARDADLDALLPKSLHPQQFTQAVRALLVVPRRSCDAAVASSFKPLAPRREPGGAPALDLLYFGGSQIVEVLRPFTALAQREDPLHGARTSRYAEVLARQLCLDVPLREALVAATPLHDIGLLAIPRRVHSHASDRDRDRDGLHHTLAGHALLQSGNHPVLSLAAEIALTHHERWDGSGHPNGLRGTAIPLSGRIVCLADALDDTLNRPDSNSDAAFAQCIADVTAQSGTRFDPRIIRVLLAALDSIYRVASTDGKGKP